MKQRSSFCTHRLRRRLKSPKVKSKDYASGCFPVTWVGTTSGCGSKWTTLVRMSLLPQHRRATAEGSRLLAAAYNELCGEDDDGFERAGGWDAWIKGGKATAATGGDEDEAGDDAPSSLNNPFDVLDVPDEKDLRRQEHKERERKVPSNEQAVAPRPLDELLAMATEDGGMWQLSHKERSKLMDKWKEERFAEHEESMAVACNALLAAKENLREALAAGDCDLLRTQQIVGMTTSGAAKNQALVRSLAPKVVIVEEVSHALSRVSTVPYHGMSGGGGDGSAHLSVAVRARRTPGAYR